MTVGRADQHDEDAPEGYGGVAGCGRRAWAAAIVIVGRADYHGEETPEGHDGVVGAVREHVGRGNCI